MSKASSAISNLSSSPLGSTIDLNDEKLFNQEIRNKKSNKQSLTMAFDPEELINVAIQEHAALNKDYFILRNQSLNQVRRIKDLQTIFEELQKRINYLCSSCSSFKANHGEDDFSSFKANHGEDFSTKKQQSIDGSRAVFKFREHSAKYETSIVNIEDSEA